MTDRLSPLDASFLYIEESTTPMHVGGLSTFRPEAGQAFDTENLRALIGRRIGLVPRYRQKVRWVPGHLANPEWVDDHEYDLSYHVRRSALPRPGSDEQLRELVGRLMSRPLDRERPLWEIYLVEGLADGRVAIITKVHHAMVDGIRAIDIGALLLDLTPEVVEVDVEPWRPARDPGALGLLGHAVTDTLRRPLGVVDTLRTNTFDARRVLGRVAEAAGGIAAVARTQMSSAPASPLNREIGTHRRFGMATTDLDDYKRVRKAHGGTINDVVLATVSGALRTWLLTRGEAVTTTTTQRAMVPVSVRGAGGAETGNRVSSYFVDLPVGEPSPIMRLHQVSYAMKAHKESGQSVGADAMIAMAGFAPPTLTALGARVGSRLSSRMFNLVVTNVPGPQYPLYSMGAPLLGIWPVVPLAKGQAVTVGLTSYNGGVFYGLNADRDALPDVDVLAGCIEESLAELVATT